MAAPRPRARLLSIGDELLNGRTVDTNAAHLARRLTDVGFRVVGTSVVGDAQADIVAALRAAGDADLVVMTGGLGPTEDDRTRHALAEVLGVPLEDSAAAWRAIVRRWRTVRPGQEPPVANRRQALLPQGATLLANDRGTAPGMWARWQDTWVAALPGVPHEMIAMAERLMPRLRRHLTLPTQRVAELYLAGVGESTIQAHLLGQFDGDDPQVGITVNDAGHLTLRVVGSPRAVAAKARDLAARVQPWRLPAAGLAPSLVATLTARGATLTTAESCTVGGVAAALGAVPGASAILTEALVAYAPAAKARRLGVSAAALQEVVSPACAEAMARGARRRTGADLAIATTGLAGPGAGGSALPVGTVVVAVADAAGVVSRTVRIDGDRRHVQTRAVGAALLLAWERVAPWSPVSKG